MIFLKNMPATEIRSCYLLCIKAVLYHYTTAPLIVGQLCHIYSRALYGVDKSLGISKDVLPISKDVLPRDWTCRFCGNLSDHRLTTFACEEDRGWVRPSPDRLQQQLCTEKVLFQMWQTKKSMTLF